MRLSVAATAAFVACAAASGAGDATEAVTLYSTFCPTPTTVSHGSQTHVVTEPTTVTFTDCTVTRPVYTKTITECNECPPVPTDIPTGVPPSLTNSVPVAPTGTLIPSQSVPIEPPIHTAAASRAVAGAGAGLAGVLGLAAFLL